MSVAICIAGWLVSAIAGFWFAQDDWRRTFHFNKDDAVFFGSMALFSGPLFLLVAFLIWVSAKMPVRLRGGEVLWERKP